MASRVFRDVQALNPETKIIAGSFKTNASSDPVAADNTGKGWSVARSGTGLWTVTLEDTYPALISGQLTLQHNAAGDHKLAFGAIDVVSAKTVVIRNNTGSSAADLAVNANNRIHFVLFLRNTDIV